MQLNQINLVNFRNFSNYELLTSKQLNIIAGKNGAGKTSLLEAIYFLGMNRSFRNRSYQPVIKHQEKFCQIVGRLLTEKNSAVTIGIEKHLHATKSQLKVSEGNASTVSLAQLLPIQLINHETFDLIDGSPQNRRAFMDWGVFYAEPEYQITWQKFQYALKQRNALLKNMDDKQIVFWELQLAEHAELLAQYRLMYIDNLLPVLQEELKILAFGEELSLEYYPGWENISLNYLSLLKQQRNRDSILGSTQLGPHRADIRIKIKNFPAEQILSRGQQKMVGFFFRLAQAKLLYEKHQKRCLFLIDDLAAELDQTYLQLAYEILIYLPNQIFMTCLETNTTGFLENSPNSQLISLLS